MVDLCGGNRFPLLLSERSFTICPTTYNRKYSVFSASLNKTFPAFLPSIYNLCSMTCISKSMVSAFLFVGGYI